MVSHLLSFSKCIFVILPMREVNLKSLDLNLLVVLEALLRERQVTRAAESLNMSQPAVSRALQRLRVTFGDPLLVRTNSGYDLTRRGEGLAAELSESLDRLANLIKPASFEPAECRDILTLYGADSEALLSVPKFLADMKRQAPNIRLVVNTSPVDGFEKLSSGEARLFVSGFEPTKSKDQYYSASLGRCRLMVVMGPNHPLADGELTIERYLAAQHGIVSITGRGAAAMDESLSRQGYQRQVQLVLSNFSMVAQFCTRSDIVFTFPEVFYASLFAGSNVVCRHLPQEIDPGEGGEFRLYWHARDHHEQMHRWARNILLQQKRLAD